MKTRHVAIHIDTSKVRVVSIRLHVDGKTREEETTPESHGAQDLLPLIETLLSRHSLGVRDITEITAETGPGSFTGLRVGIAVANSLATLLRAPLNGKRTLASPTYT